MREEIEISITDSRRLIETVNKVYNYDLGNLAFTAFKRRIAKSMIENDIINFNDFVIKIEKTPIFYSKFLKDISVNITEFFRDPSFWRYLKDNVLPILYNNFKNLQIWVPNCSSGDELISLNILLKEMNLFDHLEIYATDVNEEILEMTKKATFPESKLEASDANYKRINENGNFSKYYTLNSNRQFVIQKDLLANVQFSEFDLSKLATFKRSMHLILFRNNFIYIKSNLQENILNLFHKSLTLNGYLVIGNKETISWCSDAKKFTEINPNESVYKKTMV